ncbi:MAG: type IV toxin-antitoxin system AbiEi family antitoxin domain-containing protein [Paludibacter sp.]|nr:type IV toxin-antitoxin system AbiEi family antitoxin domain-containing protein [Paludibacter sp.]MDD4295345.1 type IV toxin-antitoxin system AbiEi family antitoxin domain-containing protein [Ruminiclostridium sp.]MDD4429272.1 type IV toxin-antitoxin system AbiEi family antitoxin domain-containing protein [Paludibacter sp.]
MDNATKLSTLIESNKGIITTKCVEANGIPRQYLSLFVAEGKLQRAGQGIYLSPDAFEDTMYLIQCRSEKIIFSNETALYIHELTDRDPLLYSVCVPRDYGIARLKQSGVVVYTVKKELHGLGKETVKTIHGRDIYAYNIERTICDIIRYRNRMDADMFSTALKRYTSGTPRNLSRLMDYAKAFRIGKTVRQYMEVLL